MIRPVLAPGVSPLVRELAEAQAAQGLSDRELARRAGVAHGTFSHMRVGRYAPKLMALEAIAGALGYRLVLAREGEE